MTPLRHLLHLVLAAGTALLLVAGVAVPSSSASHLVTPANAQVVLTQITPTVIRDRSATVTITGVVPAGTAAGAQIRVSTSATALRTRAQVADWAASAPSAAGTDTTLGSTTAGAPGSPFTVSFPARRIDPDRAYAAVPISVDVLPSLNAGAPSVSTHTFLLWHERKEYEPLRVAVAIPLTLPSDPALWSAQQTTRRAAWTSARGSGSRVDRILDGIEGVGTAGTPGGVPVTLAVDPSLLTELPTSSPPDQNPTPTPTPATSTVATEQTQPPSADPTSSQTSSQTSSPTTSPTTSGQNPAASDPTGRSELLDRLKGRPLWALPYADADVAAAADLVPSNALINHAVSGSTTVGTEVGSPARADVAWPADGLLSPTREARLGTTWKSSGRGPLAAVVIAAAIPDATAPYTPDAQQMTPAGTPTLAADQVMSTLLPTRTGVGTGPGVAARQRLLAETLALLDERAGTQRSVFIAAPRGYDPDPAALTATLTGISDAPWLEPVTADTLLTPTSRPTTRTAPLADPKLVKARVPAPQLTAPRLTDLAEQQSTLHAVASVLKDGASFEQAHQNVLAELLGVRWRGAPGPWALLERAVQSDITGATRGIKVSGQRLNFLASSGTLQVTVENELPYPVDGIRLVLAPTNLRMQIPQQPEPISIAAASKTVVRVPARAVGAGQADVRAYLTTDNGTVIGQSATLTIRANPLDSVFYWIGGIVVGAVLLLGLLRTWLKGTSRVETIDPPLIEEEVARVRDAEQGPTR